jgi:hypothetical protein
LPPSPEAATICHILPDIAETGAVVSLPRWDDPSLTLGSMMRAALWLVTVVGEGNKFTKQDLREAFPGIAQIDRRMRDLRDFGWIIDTTREDPTLAAEEFRLVQAGVPVWDRNRRVEAQLQKRHAPAGYPNRLPTLTEAVAPEVVWDQIAGLPNDDKVLVLAWLVKGRRDRTPAEKAFDAASTLPPEARQALMAQLADDLVGRIKETSPMTD